MSQMADMTALFDTVLSMSDELDGHWILTARHRHAESPPPIFIRSIEPLMERCPGRHRIGAYPRRSRRQAERYFVVCPNENVQHFVNRVARQICRTMRTSAADLNVAVLYELHASVTTA